MIKNILSQNAFWMVNKQIAKNVGIEATILLTELIDKFDYYSKKGEVVDIGGKDYFYATSPKLEDATTLTYKKQVKALAKLEKANYICIKLMGLPAKKHFTLNEEVIVKALKDKDIKGKTRYAKKEELEQPKRKNLNSQKGRTIYNKEIINKETIINIDDDEKLIKIEKPITKKEKSLNKKERVFLNSFNQITGKNFKDLDRTTRIQITSLLNYYTQEEIKIAIKNCVKDKYHKNNPRYLTPEFITRPDKFNIYLNATLDNSNEDITLGDSDTDYV